ncbi:hypothetical protein GZ212_13160 [Mangrovimonas sp. CR14]|uniref:hypothetical protein n=1 Tax=Mangrovimonas sp. CR14 TaxID=2706120 RepID=UPI00141EE9B5|nr:hypothetical protein [Mangrovimonas sp. CR14]NIK93106.1 hypothetical protein [Mangrovimonas sp. CR14]
MKKIVDHACECIQNLPDEKMDNENIGLCMLNEAAKYGDELLRDYNIDIRKIDEQGEELGRIIGVEMLISCPESIQRLASLKVDDDDNAEIYEPMIIEGKIRNISSEDFVIFTVEDNQGKTSKFYWLTFVSNSGTNIQYNFNETKNKDVKMEFIQQELFDPKINEYRNFNIIKSIEMLN